MKAYETKNTHEARNEALDNGNKALADLILAAWRVCGRLDPMWECDEEDFATIIKAVKTVDYNLAAKLAEEATKAYESHSYDVVSFFRLFEEDGMEFFEREAVRNDMSWPEIEQLMSYEGWHGEDSESREIAGKSILCIYYRQW